MFVSDQIPPRTEHDSIKLLSNLISRTEFPLGPVNFDEGEDPKWTYTRSGPLAWCIKSERRETPLQC